MIHSDLHFKYHPEACAERLDGDGGKRGLTASHYMAIAQKTEEVGWAQVCSGGRVRTAGSCSPEVTSRR